MNSCHSTTTSIQSDNFITRISDEKKEDTQGHAFLSVDPTDNMSSTDEADITHDDLAAMKAMIGDIKKDPSLLYKLSNLGAAEGPSTFGMGDLGGDVSGDNNNSRNNKTGTNNTFLHSNVLAANNAMRNSILVDDDHTEVSSLGMMSYEEGGRSLLNLSQRFSPPGKDQGNAQARESFASRTNKDVEIALRMQSLRAKKGLFNSPQVGGGTLLRSSSARQLGGIPQSQLNRSVSAPRGQEINSKVEKVDVDSKIYSKQPNLKTHTNRARSHTSPSVPTNQEYTTTRETNELRESSQSAKRETSEPIAITDRSNRNYKPDLSSEQQKNSEPSSKANSKFHRYKSDVSGEIGVGAIRKASASRQRGLITPDSQKKQAKSAATSINNQAISYTRNRDEDVSDEETPNNDDDSQTAALVLFNNSLNNIPSDEHGKQFRESLDTQLNDHSSPFQHKDSDRAAMDNAYFNVVSKYTTTRNDERDGKKNQLRRSSSSRSTSSPRNSLQQKENERRVSVSEETTRTKHSNNISKSRRATSELRQAEKQTAEYKRERKARKQKARAESSRRRRSSSEDPRATKDGLPWPPPPPPRDDVKHGRPARQSQRPSLNEYPSSSQQSMLEREPNDVMPSPGNFNHKEITTQTSMNNCSRDGEIVDTLSSLNALLGSRSSDSIAVMEVGLGEKLQRLNQRDKTPKDHNGSVSSKSVVSRFSNMVKGKTSRKGTKGTESQSYHEANSSPNGNISPKKLIESDDGSLTRSGRKLIPRLSNFTSPNQSHRRRTTTVDNNMSSSMTPSDWEKTTIRSANGGESPFIINEMGDDILMRTELDDQGEMTRSCDERGRCIFHPHIR